MTDIDNKEELATLYKYSNHKDSHYLDNLLAMFYHGVLTNAVGIMQALNTETNKEEVVLVGVKVNEDGTQECFPLSRVLTAEEASIYSAPDGEGGWKAVGGENESVH